jgi:uncharacterized membrane protein/mono/diheme cytochrome c family protein
MIFSNLYLSDFNLLTQGLSFNSLVIMLVDVDPSGLRMFLGRFHPLIVHLPIGFLFVAVALEYFSGRKKYENLRHATSFVLLLTSVSSIIAAVLGYFLSLGGGYDENTLFWHKWFGIALAAGSTLAWVFRFQFEKYTARKFRIAYIFFLVVSFLFLIGTGHQGGSLTHGSDYLTSYMPDPIREWTGLPPKEKPGFKKIKNIEAAVVHPDIIQPIINARCISCHNTSKKKGGLMLNNMENLLKGGKNGEVIVAGKPLESHLYAHLLLPESDDKHMPPKGKAQLTKEQVRIIGWWIAQGASSNKKVSELKVPDSIKTALVKFGEGEKVPEGIFASKVEPSDPKKIASLALKGLKATLIAQDVNYIQVYLAAAQDSFGLKEAEALLDISDQLAWLNLSNKKVLPEALAVLSKFPNLSRLRLENTNIQDDMLKSISSLKNLEYLNLYGTAITNSGLKHLETLKKLRVLYLWQTKITFTEARKFKARHPALLINWGQ